MSADQKERDPSSGSRLRPSAEENSVDHLKLFPMDE
jgi:hypothetical protein